jgi:hypothetical protein
VTFPDINNKDLQAFRETYGASAFVCRYLHCVFSTDGFESSSQRAKHESQHQRKFRCAHASCVYFSTGFVNRNLLNRHNERYHQATVGGPSLAESLSLHQQMTQAQQAPMYQQEANAQAQAGQGYGKPSPLISEQARYNQFKVMQDLRTKPFMGAQQVQQLGRVGAALHQPQAQRQVRNYLL